MLQFALFFYFFHWKVGRTRTLQACLTSTWDSIFWSLFNWAPATAREIANMLQEFGSFLPSEYLVGGEKTAVTLPGRCSDPVRT